MVQIDPLLRLARLSGVQTAYHTTMGTNRRAQPEELLGACQALGHPLASVDDAATVLRQMRAAHWQRGVAPVAISWDGAPFTILIKVAVSLLGDRVNYELRTEDGQHTRAGYFLIDQLPVLRQITVDGIEYLVTRLDLPGQLPWGYHKLTIEMPTWQKTVLLISSPSTTWEPAGGIPKGAWGGFLPLYSLRMPDDWGVADLGDAEVLQQWLHERGADVFATLPMLASFLRPEDGQFEPSPYAPASRLFWNELFIDIERVPELENNPEARLLLASDELQRERAELRALDHVDYARVMAAKRRVLELLARGFFATPGPRGVDFEAFVKRNPAVIDYSVFRAAFEKFGQPWVLWPEPAQSGTLNPGEYDTAVAQYHQYVQWISQEQIGSLGSHAAEHGLGLYLDMPLGVHSDGYDVWRGRKLFARLASAGAPPDDFFAAGQDWGFPPLHPERDREEGHAYFRSFVQQLMGQAGILRIDHVAGLHRLYWIPRGLSARQGVYVHYHAEEQYAILCLESHRTRTIVVGEDLGTIPPYVRSGMERHKVRRMFVQIFSMTDDSEAPLGPVTPGTVASLNTHDLPLFAGLWYGRDIEIMHGLKFLSDDQAAEEWTRRNSRKQALREHFGLKQADEGKACWELMQHATRHLARCPEGVVLVSLEDLWLEREPQNVPGTWREVPNWRRKAALGFDQFKDHGEVNAILHEVNELRTRCEQSGPLPSV